MINGIFSVPRPTNEPVLGYAPNSPEKLALKAELVRGRQSVVDIPIIIGGKNLKTEAMREVREPQNHKGVLARYTLAGKKEIKLAIKAAGAAKEQWAAMPFAHRAAIFLKSAELLAGKYRSLVVAATMLGQGKNVFQAEFDLCELVDFLRFNTVFAEEIYRQQPDSPTANGKASGIWNRLEYRPLDGFVAAISPFNFTAIAGNLCSAPALMGNTVVWKPSAGAMLSNYYVMRAFEEAGLPAGVINFVPMDGADAEKYLISHHDMSGVHFTGSTEVFGDIWSRIGKNIHKYRSYPRIVGETGGKGFVFAHSSADVPALVTALIRGAFEYSGQKCSAASRAFIPASIFPAVKSLLMSEIGRIKQGDVADFSTLLGAVINKEAYDRLRAAIDTAKKSPDAEVLCGGCDESKGWFVKPTVILARKADYPTMSRELFGPLLTIYVYKDKDIERALRQCDKGSAYALTGAVFARDRQAIADIERALSGAAGNFYINDKPAGAVVGQQPLGGTRASGTNDKSGSILNLYRWVSPRTIKEVLVPPTDFAYPYMIES